MRLIVFALVSVLSLSFLRADSVTAQVDWPKFMARHDLVWEKLPVRWEESPYLGNGNMGSMLYVDEKSNRLRLQVFRVDVQDHRDQTHGWTAYSRPRLMIGSFYLKPVGKITGGSWRQGLWNAEVYGTVKTDKGAIHFTHLVHTDDMAIKTMLEYEGEETGAKWTWEPHPAETTRPGYPRKQEEIKKFANRYGERYRNTLKVWEPNPPVKLSQQDGVHVSTQDLLAGGQYAVAWKLGRRGSQEDFTVSIGKSYPEFTAAVEAVKVVKKVASADLAKWIAAHRKWWHAYFPKSFVSFPDTRLESFYWHQIFKMACATRMDRPMMDTAGPWLQKTPWPYITWDLNVQLCYWTPCASNRLDLAQSLIETLHKNRQNLINNVRPTSWQKDSAYIPVVSSQDLNEPRNGDRRYYDCVGNLPWAMHNCWLIYRHTMDDEQLREKIYPLMKRGVNLYRHMLKKGEDGKYHLPKTYSPEVGSAPDCNYDLALLKWSCQALVDAAKRLKINDPLVPVWQDIVANLADFPVDENGFMRGAGVPWNSSHRHYSHLLMAYPLYLVNAEQGEEKKKLIKKSLEHWVGFKGALVGYSYTGAASIAAAIGEGDESLKYLKGLERFLQPNGLYKEAGPVMETPISAAQSMHDMMLQSWGDTIRVFPAMPKAWKETSFHDLRAEGAFLVSAVRKDGKTQLVRVKSLAGEPLKIRPGFEGAFQVHGKRSHWVNQKSAGVYSIDLQKGEEIVLSQSGQKSGLVKPVSVDPAKVNTFGKR